MSYPNFNRSQWRLLIHESADGASNMAIDQAIGDAVRTGRSLPTLRFYRWQPACISLGQSQSADLLDQSRCATFGWQIVRRATGGRTVLHADELTYSIAIPQTDPRAKGGVLQSYQRLSLGLQAGLTLAGLAPQRAQKDSAVSVPNDAACFNTASVYELLVAGRKLIGSAQMRSRGLVLQHGSLPLRGDITRLIDGLNLDAGQRLAAKQRLLAQAITLSEAMGCEINSADLVTHLTNGFASALNIDFVSSQLSDDEQAHAAQIRAQKFANLAWTYRK
ncbi:MAG: lipoate--protein ligase family protein [Candidatus Promineifilaceae bacterium]